jgi:hypothetical protein
MSRESNTDVKGNAFSSSIVNDVWEKGKKIDNVSPDFARRDFCGAFMYKNEYGKHTPNGWEIDHVKPVSKGGTDDINNLHPLHWINNQHKGDNHPNWDCKKSV